MIYGDIYSDLTNNCFKKIFKINNLFIVEIAKIYFKIFGYPDVNGYGRFKKVIKMLAPHKNDLILDCGCGNGIYGNTIASKYSSKIVAYDIDKERIERAAKIALCLKNKALFLNLDLMKVKAKKNSVDKIILLEVLEHIQEDEAILRKLNVMLKKGGLLILSTPKRENLSKRNEKILYKNSPRGEHVRSGYELDTLRKLLIRSNFKIIKINYYYRFFAKIAIKWQHWLYKKHFYKMIVLTFPLIRILPDIDNIISINNYYRGFIIKAVKI